MDNLRSLMQSLDSISGLIPEGTYLEMANNLKKVHAHIPKERTTEPMQLRVDVPFMPTLPDPDSEPPYDEDPFDIQHDDYPEAQDPFDIPYDDEPYDERYYPTSSQIPNIGVNLRNPEQGFFVSFERNRDGTGCMISRTVERCLLRQDLILINKYEKECLKKMRELKPIKNVTARVREEAIRSYINVRGLNIQTFTFECMYRTYPQIFGYDMRIRMFTREGELTRFGKEVERDIYAEYIEFHNALIQLKSLDAHTELNWLIQAKRISTDRLSELSGR